MRSTSIQAYHQIKDEGLLSELRFRVYEIMVNHGPMTAQECWQIYRKKYNAKSRDGITQRPSELERLGVIKVKRKRPCSVTGRNCIEWEATENLPQKPRKELSNSEKIRRLKKAYLLVRPYAPKEVQQKAQQILKEGFDV